MLSFPCNFFLAGAPFFKIFLYFFDTINIMEVGIYNFKVLDNFILPVSLLSQSLLLSLKSHLFTRQMEKNKICQKWRWPRNEKCCWNLGNNFLNYNFLGNCHSWIPQRVTLQGWLLTLFQQNAHQCHTQSLWPHHLTCLIFFKWCRDSEVLGNMWVTTNISTWSFTQLSLPLQKAYLRIVVIIAYSLLGPWTQGFSN